MKAAIVGCGIAGIACALELARDGAHAVLFERAAIPAPVGSGLLLQPPGLAALERLGLARAAIASGARIESLDGRTSSNRRVLDLRYARWHPDAFGLGIHRGALWQLLFDAAQRAGVEVRAGVELEAQDARLEGFDLVVYACGSRTKLREGLHCDDRTRTYPWGAMYATVPAPRGWDETCLAQRFHGTSRMMGILPIGRDARGGGPWLAMFWSERLDRMDAVRNREWQAWRREVLALWPEAEAAIEPLRGFDDLIVAAYADVRVQPWIGERHVIVGDMAHGTSPQLGQGATLALLDARALGDCLRASGPGPAALRAFAQQRRSHVAFYQWASRMLTPFFQSDGRVLGVLRDAFMGPAGRLPGIHREFLATLTGHKAGILPGRRLHS